VVSPITMCSDKYIALFTHFTTCGVWEAVYILDGLPKNSVIFNRCFARRYSRSIWTCTICKDSGLGVGQGRISSNGL